MSMNIAYILNSTAVTSGATKAFLNMLDGLIPKGIKPFVVVPDKDGVYEELQRRQITTLVVTYRSSAYPPLQTLRQFFLFLPKLAARLTVNLKATSILTTWLKEKQIDIVHSNTGVVRIGFDAAQRAGIPHIYHIREYADKIGIHYFPTKSFFESQLKRGNSYNICITKDIQEYYHQNGNRASLLIYDGVFPFISKMPNITRKNYFLFAGRIQPAKGVDFLLKAYKIYAEKAAKPLPLKIAGSHDNDYYFKNQVAFVKDCGRSELVEFLGNSKDITTLMREARALIVSSPFEGFGFCMPEAQQQGCLVIARNTSGTKEQLDNALQMTGQEIALRYLSVEELAAWLTKVAEEPQEQFRPYTELAFKVVNQLYTKEANAQQVFRFYHRIIAASYQAAKNQETSCLPECQQSTKTKNERR